MDRDSFIAAAIAAGYDDAEIAELVKLHDDDGLPFDKIPLIEHIVEYHSPIRAEGPTPNGGAYSEAFFYDGRGNPADPDRATRVMINEYDKDGNVIFTTYGKTRYGEQDKNSAEY